MGEESGPKDENIENLRKEKEAAERARDDLESQLQGKLTDEDINNLRNEKEAAETARDNLEKEKADLLTKAISEKEIQNKVAEMERTLEKLRDTNEKLAER